MAYINRIIKAIDEFLERKHQKTTTPVEINSYLERLNLLTDSASRPGKPIRELLRNGKIPHAYRSEGKWVISHSGNIPQKMSVMKTTKIEVNKLVGNPSTIEFLLKNKFEKTGTLSQLLRNELAKNENLNRSGVYAISIPDGYVPEYYSCEEVENRGNVINPWNLERLKDKWVFNAEIVYYGLAGQTSNRSLNARLNDLRRHGNGKTTSSGPHKGGEILWQLKNYESFSIWILPTNGSPEPINLKKSILKTFRKEKTKLPFANRQ